MKAQETRAQRSIPDRCAYCGQFVAFADIAVHGTAVTRMVTPDSAFTREEYETYLEVNEVEWRETRPGRSSRGRRGCCVNEQRTTDHLLPPWRALLGFLCAGAGAFAAYYIGNHPAACILAGCSGMWLQSWSNRMAHKYRIGDLA